MADGTRSWSHGETAALIEAWGPLYHRRRAGEFDVWLSEKDRRRVRSTGSLVTADWRAVATAVNSYRAEARLLPSRTHRHCKSRMNRLRSNFGDELLATPGWYEFMPNSTASRRGGLRMRSLNDVLATAGVVTGAGAAAENAVAASAVESSEASSEEDEDPPSEPVAFAVTTGFFSAMPPVPKKRRTGASTSTSNVTPTATSTFKVPASLPEMAAAMDDLHAAESNEVAVVMANVVELAKDVFKNMVTTYRELAKDRIELRKQMLAALGAAAGGAAAPEPAG